MIHAVIMAGGSGTRFWPASRRALPKQFLRFGSDRSLLQETADRCRSFIPAERIWVVTGEAHADETRRQLPDLDSAKLLLEPCGRNTAPCIGLAAIQLLAVDPEAVMLVLPADHRIQPLAAFQQSAERAFELIALQPERLMLFGVSPTEPATGFGYIERGAALSANSSAFQVASFREKPDAETAARYVASGDFFWNCGIFVWRAEAILRQIERHAPDLLARLTALRTAIGTTDWPAKLATEFRQMPNISIDYAVLEKAAADVCVVPATFDWDDVGSWQALARQIAPDSRGNTIDGRFCGVGTNGCIVRSEPDHLIATFGVSNLVIVQTPTATLIADRHDELGLKQLIAEMERQGMSEFL